MLVPNAATAQAGFRPGQTINGMLIAPYLPGAQFAVQYISPKCPNFVMGERTERRDLAQQVWTDIARANTAYSQGVTLYTHAGQITFRCGPKVGKAIVSPWEDILPTPI
jgi:hypothetical protein